MVPLPPPEEVSAKAFVISTPLQRLLQCRSKVNDLLATNAMVQEVNGNPSAFRDLKVFLLMQHYQPPTGGTPVPTVSDDLRCKISVEDNNGR